MADLRFGFVGDLGLRIWDFLISDRGDEINLVNPLIVSSPSSCLHPPHLLKKTVQLDGLNN
jgi:hypothetical protein